MSRFRPVFLSLIALGFAALSACDKVALLAPTGSTLTLSINTTTVPINGTAIVKASVIEAGNTPVHDGTTVTFTASFGTIEPTEAQTQGGVATVTFRGTSSGTAKISAFSGSAKAEITDVKVGGAAAGTVAMRSTPSSLPQGGGTVDIFAIVRDTSGNLLPGAPVSFTTDFGNLSSTAATTDANGEAKVNLTTTRDAIVTATVVSGVTATTSVKINPAPTVTITTTATNPAVGVGITFNVTPTVASGGSPIQNVSVNFGDGNSRSLGNVTGQTGVVHTYAAPGVYTVTASATDQAGQTGTGSTAINVQRLLPTVTLTGLPSSTTAGSTVSGTVSAAAASGGPPITNVQVAQGGTVLYSGTGSGGFSRQLTSTGSYTFTATATDAAGTQATTSAVVVVGARAAIEVKLDATATTGAALNCTSQTVYPKSCTITLFQTVAFSVSTGALPSGLSATGYSWQLTGGQPFTTSSPNASLSFNNTGQFVLTVTVTFSDGTTGTQTINLAVS